MVVAAGMSLGCRNYRPALILGRFSLLSLRHQGSRAGRHQCGREGHDASPTGTTAAASPAGSSSAESGRVAVMNRGQEGASRRRVPNPIHAMPLNHEG